MTAFIDLPEIKDLIPEKTRSQLPLASNLCSNLLCHILTIAFEISRAITPEMFFLSSASLIPRVVIFKASAVELDDR